MMERPIPKPRKILATPKQQQSSILTYNKNGRGKMTETTVESDNFFLKRSNSTATIRPSALRLRESSKIAIECSKNQERTKDSDTGIGKKRFSNIFNSDAVSQRNSAIIDSTDSTTNNYDNNNNNNSNNINDNVGHKGVVVGIKSKFENLAKSRSNFCEISKSFVISRDSAKSNLKSVRDTQQNGKLRCVNENFAEVILKYFLNESVFAKVQQKTIASESVDSVVTSGSILDLNEDNTGKSSSPYHSNAAKNSTGVEELSNIHPKDDFSNNEDVVSSAKASKIVALLPIAKVDCWIPLQHTEDVNKDDSTTSKNISTSVCLARKNSTSANCKVRVLPRVHEMRRDFHCNQPDFDVKPQNSEATKATTIWPQPTLQHNSPKSSPQSTSMIPILKNAINKKKLSENIETNSKYVNHTSNNAYDELVNGNGNDIIVSSCVALTLPYVAKESTRADILAVEKQNGKELEMSRKGVTLLERLVKTHPIWFLPHLGRTAAIHLLAPMTPGIFVVRGSSRNSAVKLEQLGESQCKAFISPRASNASHLTTMALSVRLSAQNAEGLHSSKALRPASCGDVDHYLIETIAGGTGIRLEGSPFTFKSLPLLLQHYCINGDELQTRLRLPSTILECDSIQSLQAVALFGQEFWVNEVSGQALLTTSRQQRQQEQHDMQSNRIQQQHICFDNKPDQYGIIQSDQLREDRQQNRREKQSNYTSTTNQPAVSTTTVQQALTKPTKRTAPIVMHNPMIVTPNQQQGHCYCCNCVARSDCYKTSTFTQSTPQSSHQLLQHSHRSNVNANTTRSNNVQELASQGGASVWARHANAPIPLKSKSSALSPSTSATGNSRKTRHPIEINNAESVRGQSCWYVNPRTNSNQISPGEYQEFSDGHKRHFGMLKKSQSAFEGFESEPSISSQSSLKSTRSKKADKNDSGSVKGSSFLRSLFSTSNSNLVKAFNNNNNNTKQPQENDDYFLPFGAGTSTSGVNFYETTGRENDASRDNSMTRRAKTFARRILPFSNNNNNDGETDNTSNLSSFRHKSGNSKDDSCKKLSEEAIRARQTAFKRRNTDLCAQSVHRLAGQLAPFENSPPPEFLRQNAKNSAVHRKNVDGSAANQSSAKNQRQKIHQRIMPIFRAGSLQENQKTEDGGQQNKQQYDQQHPPLVPPAGKVAMDEDAMQMCIDELRRKRMQSTELTGKESQLPNGVSEIGSTVILRRNKLRASRSEKSRRSVPEASDELNCEGNDHADVSKQQDHTNQLVNDGLITPTLRRKNYQSQHDPLTVDNAINEIYAKSVESSQRLDGSALASNIRISDNLNDSTPQVHEKSQQHSLNNYQNTAKNLFDDQLNLSNSCSLNSHADDLQKQMSSIKSQQSQTNNKLFHTDENERHELLSENENHQHEASCSKDEHSSHQIATIPSITFRNSTKMTSFHSGSSTQSPLRQSKIATVRPQQHMILNNSSSNESSNGGSPPEVAKTTDKMAMKKSSSQRSSKGISADNAGKIHVEPTSKERESCFPLINTPPTSASSSAVFHTANNDEARSPPSKRQSEYAQIGELSQYFTEESPRDSNASKNVISISNLEVPLTNEEDAVSVAGTDFNEPWDSNAWNNLLDLARFGDEKSTAAVAIKALHSTETIVEEDDLSSPEELTLRAGTHYGDYDDDIMSSVVEEHFAPNDEDFDSLPRSQHGSNHNQPHQRHPYQLQQYLNIIPEKDFSPNTSDKLEPEDFGHDSKDAHDLSAGGDSSRLGSEGSNLRTRRTGTSKPSIEDDNGNIIAEKDATSDNQNVEMEATAMAAVLGSCGPRAICAEVGDGRISAVAKLAVSTPSSISSALVSPRKGNQLCSGDGTWRRQRNQTFRMEKDHENQPNYQQHGARKMREEATIELAEEEDFLNNNNSTGATRCVVPPQPPQRLKSSLSFSSPFASSKAEHTTKGGGVKSLVLGGGGGDAASLGTNSYGRRRNGGSDYGTIYGGGSVHDTLSLHRMQNPLRAADLNSSLNNLTMQLPLLSPIISPPRLRNAQNHDSEPSNVLQRYVEQLAANENTLFGATLHRFIECTVESEETDPHVVIRRVRQFLNGMKNYLVKNGELDLHRLIERESDKLNSNEFLNIDAIFETVLTKILLVPIKGHLYHLMVRENTRNGQLQRLSENLSFIRAMEPTELGFSAGTDMPDSATMEQIRCYLRRMQNHYSPLKKLENLLKALSLAISRSASNAAHPSEGSGADNSFVGPGRSQSGDNMGTLDSRTTATSSNGGGTASHSGGVATSQSASSFGGGMGTPGGRRTAESFFYQTKHQSLERLAARVDASGAVSLGPIGKHLPGEELIRWLVYLLAKSSAINCEIEAWYIWELLPQQLLTTGEAAYYLSTLFSAVGVLKNPESIRRLKSASSQDAYLTGSLTTLQECTEEASDAFLRIAVPNEHEGSIEYHTFPILPQMNVVKLCRVIAHQFAITNPEDYGLYILFDGFETALLPKEYPQVIRDQLSEAGKSHLFAYKRNEARIAWPKNAATSCTPTEFQPRLL